MTKVKYDKIKQNKLLLNKQQKATSPLPPPPVNNCKVHGMPSLSWHDVCIAKFYCLANNLKHIKYICHRAYPGMPNYVHSPKSVPSCGVILTCIDYILLQLQASLHPKGHLKQFSRFCTAHVVTNRLTDRLRNSGNDKAASMLTHAMQPLKYL